jgi:hypothetical protein
VSPLTPIRTQDTANPAWSGTTSHKQGVRLFGRSVGRWFSCELPAACCQLPSDSRDSKDSITQRT